MACHNCNVNDEYCFIDKKLCKKCFLNLVEKTVRKNLRLSKKLSKDSNLVVVGALAKHFVEKIVSVPCKISFIDSIVNCDLNDSSATFIVGTCLDDVCSEFLEELFKGRLKIEEADSRFVQIFRNIPIDVLEQYSKIKEISFKSEESETRDFLKKIEKKHPGVKSGLLKSIDILEGVVKNK